MKEGEIDNVIEEFLRVSLDGSSCIIEVSEKPLFGVAGTKFETVYMTRKQYDDLCA